MAGVINITAYSDALVVLGTAGIVVPVAKRLGVSPILAYLAAGTLLGPLALGALSATYPWLWYFTVSDPKNVTGFADLGVVFLLFLIGIELSYARLMAMRRFVFGLGGLQVGITTAVLSGALVMMGHATAPAVIIGAALALSSTAIVLELLATQKRLPTLTGRASFSILLAQDLAVIPILMLVALLGAGPGQSVMASLGKALAQAAVALAVIVLFGRLLLRPLFRTVASARSSELFIAATLFVIIASGVIAHGAGVSMALGAFVAGLLLAETEYRKLIEATIEPFKGLLLGLFFFSVGMSLDLGKVLRDPVSIAAAVVGLVAVKALIVAALARVFWLSTAASIESALVLGPAGEFAFVAISAAVVVGIVKPAVAAYFLTVAALSMALIPALDRLARTIALRLAQPKRAGPELLARPDPTERHAIVVGHGRVGRMVCQLLREHRVPFIATDTDPATISREHAEGRRVYYGDATDSAFLNSCGLGHATGIVITIADRDKVDAIVRQVRSARPDVLIVSRARDADHARHLYEVGATDAVPETIEASLQLSEAALVGLGVPAGPVIASIHEQRDVVRHTLQEAAHRTGNTQSRGLRAKTPTTEAL